MKRELQIKRDQIKLLIQKDFKLKYNATALGFAWSLLMPLLTSVVYYFVFGVMLRFDLKNYLLYLISGTFLWQLFANVVMMSGDVLHANSALLKKTSFDREVLIWSTFFTESAHFLLTIPVLLGIMLFYRVVPAWTMIPNALVAYLGLMLFAVGIAYVYSSVNLYFRDMERIVGIFIQLWMFATPVFLPLNAIPAKYDWVFKVNPMAQILIVWRNAFYEPAFDLSNLYLVFLEGLVVVVLGRMIFKRLEPSFAEMM